VANPLTVAIRGKGISSFLKRSLAIGRRYGLKSSRMDHMIERFARILERFDCHATFPLTARALTGNDGTLRKCQSQGIEFAGHGYCHVDYSQLTLDQQLDHLNKMRQTFEAHHLQCGGFRCPYLRWNRDTLTALRKLNFSYDSSQALAWDVVGEMATETYRRALDFYAALSATKYPALPRLTNGLVRIPYCLPDDEALVDRLQLAGPTQMSEMWLKVLCSTYESGELFTLGLHPERIALCEAALEAVLSHARSLSPTVWIARLDEIASWWRSRAETVYRVARAPQGSFRLKVDGPEGTVVLARSVAVEAPAEPWIDGYQRVLSRGFVFRAGKLPFIGLAPDVPATLVDFLRQQGYLVEMGSDAQSYTFYVDRTDFAPEDERPLLAQIERGAWPLLRLARWPGGARSALAVTGDLDALTLWDYVLRMTGRRSRL
jgi:hypothetical protein